MPAKLPETSGRTEQERAAQREASRRFYAKHPERVKAWVRKWQTEGNPEAYDLIQIRTKRKGEPPTRPRPEACEVCAGKHAKNRIHYEHCHVTGRFRGWLCSRCNTALGYVHDDPALLRKLADYLEGRLPSDSAPQ